MLNKSPVKIQILSRYVPVANRAGHFTYLLDFMRYLHQTGYLLELVVLDPWCQAQNIPQIVREMAQIVIMPSLFVTPHEKGYRTWTIKSLFRPFYTRLPLLFQAYLRQAVYRLRGKPLPGVYERHDVLAMPEEIAFARDRVAAFQPDVLILNHTYLGNILAAFPQNCAFLKVILTIHVEHQRTRDYQAAGLSSNDSTWDWEKEAKQLHDADVVIAIQKDDVELLKQMAPHSEVICAPMSATYHTHDDAELAPGRCLFVASDIDHNVYGLQWFLNHVWPLILRDAPTCFFHVCGSVCAHISGVYPNVQLLGRIEDVAREYAAAEVCVIPLIVGSGLKIKLVEALSHGRACVATSVGIQGVQELASKAVLLADEPQNFAEAVVSILKHPEQRQAMEAQARRYVIEQLSPEKVYQPFVQSISQHFLQKAANRT
jgi:glycosyltransferase involved in cell wall biosynthesis